MPLNCVAGEDSWESWTARRSNQSILKEINPEYSLEGLMLKPKLQYFGHLMWIGDSLGKSLMLGKIEGIRRRWCQRMRWPDGITNAMKVNLGKLWEMMRDRETWSAEVHGITKGQTWLDDWKTTLIGGQGYIIYELNKERVRVCWGRLLCMILITKATKCKPKKQFPTWSQNWLLCNSQTVYSSGNYIQQPLFSSQGGNLTLPTCEWL